MSFASAVLQASFHFSDKVLGCITNSSFSLLLQCQICRASFMCTASATKLQEHVDSKHSKNGFAVSHSDIQLFGPLSQGHMLFATRLLQELMSCRLAFQKHKLHRSHVDIS